MQFSYASRKKTIFHLAFFKYTGIIKKWIKVCKSFKFTFKFKVCKCMFKNTKLKKKK